MTCHIRPLLAFALVCAVLLACSTTKRGKPALASTHREAIYKTLKAHSLPTPQSLDTTDAGFLVATYELDSPPLSPRRFAENILMAIREAMLPFKIIENYRVTLNGPPPGTGMVRRYGSARMVGGVVQWEEGVSY